MLGVLAESEAVAGAAGEMSVAARERLARALASVAGKASARRYEELAAKRDALLAFA